MGNSDGGDSRDILRQLKWLVLILLISNIALGIFGYYYLRAIDRRYSTLITEVIPALSELQTLTAGTAEAMRGTNPSLYVGTADRVPQLDRARNALRRERDLREAVVNSQWFSSNPDYSERLTKAGADFDRQADATLGIVEKGDIGEANQYRENALRPAFAHYLEATTEVSDLIESHSLRANSTLTASTGNISKVMLGLGSWPLLIAGLFVLVTAIFIIGVLISVPMRKKEVT